MAYLALYRKWRPRTFSEVVGQKHISVPLKRAIEQDRLAHAYLFSGPRGTGKTSMAKILSKAVNCEHPLDANPCNECQNCKEINSGASLDVYEIDAASNRGIEEIRALKESVRTLPSTCRKKVYIIDEVHMLTKEAFNALLKTLEEPPAHVLFILATTEPEKIPLTILSRCQRYEFHRISVEDIKQHLLHIAKESNLPLTDDAADLIAVRADGGLRDALSLLDQCSSASEKDTLDAATVYDLLGLTGKDQIISLSHHIFQGKSGEALTLFYDILQNGKEPAAILRDLLEHLRNLMICRINPKAPELSAYGKNSDILHQDAGNLSEAYLDALFNYLHQSLTETKRSSSPRMSAEMGLLHLCRLKGSASLDSLAERVAALENALATLQRNGIPAPAAPASFATQPAPFTPPASFAAPMPAPAPIAPAPAPTPVPPPAPIASPPAPTPRPTPAPAPRPTPAPALRPAPAPSPRPQPVQPAAPISPAPSASAAVDASLLEPAAYDTIWKKVLSYFMSIHRMDLYTCYQKGVLIYATRQRAVIVSPQQWLVSAGNNKSYQKIAAEAFQRVVGSPVEVHAVLRGGAEEAETMALLRATQEALRSGAAPASAPPPTPSAPDGYQKVEAAQIKEEDRNAPSFKEALKILPDCDIYEKIDT